MATFAVPGQKKSRLKRRDLVSGKNSVNYFTSGALVLARCFAMSKCSCKVGSVF